MIFTSSLCSKNQAPNKAIKARTLERDYKQISNKK